MSDAMSDGDVFHEGGMSHSRRKTCPICQEEGKKARRGKMSELERKSEDMIEETLRAIKSGTLELYIEDVARRLYEAEKTTEVTREQLQHSFESGRVAERERITRLVNPEPWKK